MTRTIKRSVIIQGHATSVSLEDDFWEALQEIAKSRAMTANDIITEIDVNRTESARTVGLSSAVRLYILKYYRENGTTDRKTD